MNLTVERKRRIVLIGATGHLGGKVAAIALARGYDVKVLVRPTTSLDSLKQLGITNFVQGDLLDARSLETALEGCEAAISTAIGYAKRRPGDWKGEADTLGNRNLADAALRVGLPRLIFCSVLTCDKAQEVPHFWDKKLSEDYFEEREVPFVALRPGAFLDQGRNDFWAAGLRKGKLVFASNPAVKATFIFSNDLAKHLVSCVELEGIPQALRVDIGCDRPVSIEDLAEIMTKTLGRKIRPQVPPWPLVSLALGVAGWFDPWKKDLRAMMRYFQQGKYLANTALQERYFGPTTSIEKSVEAYLCSVGLLDAGTNR